MKIYNSFASYDARRKYVCRSDITADLLKEMKLYDYISVKEAIQVFDSISDINLIRYVMTGSIKDKKRRRRTKFVSRYTLYKAIIQS